MLPEFILYKSDLTCLLVSQNQFTGTLPRLGPVARPVLQHLLVHSNKFSGLLPDLSRCCPSLLSFVGSENYFQGALPALRPFPLMSNFVA
eukprot:1216809-Amphidinium_carterae.1